jgi:CMP-N-acetylneuraminic acid synthetase
MIKRKEVIFTTPTPRGAKGILRKNIKLFAGYPLIAYCITTALQAEMMTHVLVSTDDQGIAEIAKYFGVETPLLCPVELAIGSSIDLPAFRHTLNWAVKHKGGIVDDKT